MKIKIKKVSRACNLLKIPVSLNIEQTFAPAGIGSSGGEWIDGNKKCSNWRVCYDAQRDCKWAIGILNSENDYLK